MSRHVWRVGVDGRWRPASDRDAGSSDPEVIVIRDGADDSQPWRWYADGRVDDDGYHTCDHGRASTYAGARASARAALAIR